MYTKQARLRRKAKLERLALIKERHRRLILEPRREAHADIAGDLDGEAFEFDFDFDLDLN